MKRSGSGVRARRIRAVCDCASSEVARTASARASRATPRAVRSKLGRRATVAVVARANRAEPYVSGVLFGTAFCQGAQTLMECALRLAPISRATDDQMNPGSGRIEKFSEHLRVG